MSSQLIRRPVALVLLRRAEHLLFAVLLGVAAVRAVPSSGRPVLLASLAVLFAAWYAAGVALARRARDRAVAAGWLAVLVLLWLVLVAIDEDFVWIVFVLFLLAMQVLPRVAALVSVAVLTVAAIVAIAGHRGAVVPAAVLGPVIGAAVAVVMTVVYRDLTGEARENARLVRELTEAQQRLGETERRAGTMAERERLAAEIHDTVGQALSSIILLAQGTAGTADTVAARHRLDTIAAAARSALTETRRLVRALAPAELIGRSLPQALERAAAATRGLGVGARLTVEGDGYPLPTQTEVTLLRVAQEALANVRAHASANTVVVTLTYLPDVVTLDVVDDGRGFDPADPGSPTTGTGLGLAAMRRRVEAAGGELVVESAAGDGTALSAWVPVALGADS